MIDLKHLREQPDLYQKACDAKNISVSISAVVALDEEVRHMRARYEELKAKQNEGSKKIPTLQGDEKTALLNEMKLLSDEIKPINDALSPKEEELQTLLFQISGPLDPTTPIGKDDSDNVVERTWGEQPKFGFTPKEHWELALNLDILDLERGAKVSGSRFYYMKGNLVLLHRALQQYTLDVIMKRNFIPMFPPVLVREEAMYGSGFFPADRNEIYEVGDEDGGTLYLIGTSEVPLMNYHANEILDESQLPLKYAGISPCFRKEAGTYGKDMKGILRVHQFEKVEMVVLTTPDKAVEAHEEILAIEEEILQGLELPYQVVNICSGDLGTPAAKKYDIEAWMPGQGKYREVTSTSNCTDFQTRRAKTRYKTADGENHFAYGLNGTGTSMRPLIAIMENYQQEDGSINVPKVLQPYMGGRTKL